MACVGLYGTMSYNVAREIGEIGIRLALGAQRGAVVWMVLRRVLLLAAAGLAIGVPAALGGSQLVKSFLFGTQTNDPRILALAGVVLLSAAILAGYAPARRASRIDPVAALRRSRAHNENVGRMIAQITEVIDPSPTVPGQGTGSVSQFLQNTIG